MGDGAEDALNWEIGREAHAYARRALYGEDLSLTEQVALRLLKGLHTQGDGSTMEISKMKDSHLKNCIARGERIGGDFWRLELPVLREELSSRKSKEKP